MPLPAHTVVEGDTLSAIAAKYNTTVQAIMSVNPAITNADMIIVGQTIALPGASGSAQVARRERKERIPTCLLVCPMMR